MIQREKRSKNPILTIGFILFIVNVGNNLVGAIISLLLILIGYFNKTNKD